MCDARPQDEVTIEKHGRHPGAPVVVRVADVFHQVRRQVEPEVSEGREKDGARIVLGKLNRAQRQELDELLDYASQAVESIIAEGVEKSMTKFNRRAQGLNEEER